MDRLTDETDAHDIGCHATGYEDIIASLHDHELERIYMRLAAFEDTGLAPDEVEALKAERDRFKARAEAAEKDLLHAMENSDSLMSCEPCVNRGYEPGEGMFCKLKSCRPEWRGPEGANT